MTINDDIPLKFPGAPGSQFVDQVVSMNGARPMVGFQNKSPGFGSNKKTTSAFCSGVSLRPNKNCGSKKTT